MLRNEDELEFAKRFELVRILTCGLLLLSWEMEYKREKAVRWEEEGKENEIKSVGSDPALKALGFSCQKSQN